MKPRESDLNPFLQGNFAPWRMEGDAEDLDVDGWLPEDLVGTYYRNGPNPAFEPLGRYHWFDGDGMIHAITLRDGRAHYRNRYVKNPGYLEERAAGQALYPGILSIPPGELPAFKITGNTNIVFHAGRLLALVENGLPTEIARGSLETIGFHDFAGRLAGPMTAHPKIDPETGEMLFFGYSPFPPYLQYYVADAAGALIHAEAIDVAWPSMMHDFAITRDHVVFLLFPVVLDVEGVEKNGTVFAWQPERGSRIGVKPRRGGSGDVRWFETDACFAFHTLNAYQEEGTLVLDVARYAEFGFMGPRSARDPDVRDRNASRLARWRIDLERGGVKLEPLDDAGCEFPRVNETLLGRKHRFGYVAAADRRGESGLPAWSAIQKHDLERGRIERRDFGAGSGASEPLFVPRGGAGDEDDGCVIVLVYDGARGASDFYVLDARDVAGEPMARVRLPHRVPYGFHGNWVPEA